jgi:hypothetical protein
VGLVSHGAFTANRPSFLLCTYFRHLAPILTLLYDFIYMSTSRLMEKGWELHGFGGSYWKGKWALLGSFGVLPHIHSVISDIYVLYDSFLY